MMEVTEEYLTSMGVTKGARNKLVICIQKLKERFHTLEQFEHDLRNGTVALSVVLAEMSEMLKTPIKPIDTHNNEDVATQFMKLLELGMANELIVGFRLSLYLWILFFVFSISIAAHCMLTTSNQLNAYDQHIVHAMLQVIVSASHNEAFASRRNRLREFQYHMSEINKQFPKAYSKNGVGNSGAGNANKSRYTQLSVPFSIP